MSHWTDAATDPYLQGFYRPVTEEHDARRLTATGALPAALRGTFIKNGPNQRFEPLGRFHPFDGDGMLHAVYLDDEGVHYRNRFIRTPGFVFEEKLGRNAYGGFAELRPPLPEAMREVGMFKNVANTHVVAHGGKLLALWEGGMPIEVTEALETRGPLSLEGYDGPFTAHPCIDPDSGEMVAFGYNAFPPFLTLLVLDASGKLTHKRVIDIPRAVMMHAFAITKTYAVFLDAPALFAVNDAISGKGPIIQWKPEHGCRIGVVPRSGDGAVRWFEIEPCFVYHFLNAYQEGEVLQVDAGKLDRLNTFGMTEGLIDPPSQLTRFTIDLTRGTVTTQKLDGRRLEFPRIHDGFVGKKHSIGYAATFSGEPRMANYDTTLRYDLASGETQAYFHGEGRFVGELVHAPDPAARDVESAGWLLGYVYDSARDASDFVVFEARDVARGPIATVALPCRVTSGIHASWLPRAPQK